MPAEEGTRPSVVAFDDTVAVRPFRRLLVANRGEIVTRVARSAQALGLSVVGVFSDADATGRWLEELDAVVRLPGRAARDTYLAASALIAAAERLGADAVHPGYGFLSEDPAFAQAVQQAGLVWVGPPPAAMAAMAGKRTAKRRVAAAGVPVLPGADVTVASAAEATAGAGAQAAHTGAAADVEAWLAAAAQIGYPLLVKASAGGGGRGMRVVSHPDDLPAAVRAASREAAAAFGDGTVFLERYVQDARHVEVQVLADAHGGLVHLFERECSLQRRHQKVLEESPSPGVTAHLRDALTAAACAAARAVGYVGVGTVEFVVFAGPDGAPTAAFLEMNTRLQVEHPVTEAVTGLDLVALQLDVAAGRPLPCTQRDVRSRGHAVEVRLVAEDPAHGWIPAAGVLRRFEPVTGPGVRVDTAVTSGSDVPAEYDSLLAKVVAHGRDRAEALTRLSAALRGLRVHGVPTNREALLALLDDAAVRAGATTTTLLDERGDLLVPKPLALRARARPAAVAACVCTQRDAHLGPLDGLAPVGWRMLGAPSVSRHLVDPMGPLALVLRPGRTAWTALVRDGADEVTLDVLVHADDGEWVDVEVDGVRARWAVLTTPAGGPVPDEGDRLVDVFGDGAAVTFHEPARLPAPRAVETARGPAAPVPGSVVAVLVEPGQRVRAGTDLVVLEAMKMEHRVRADVDAVVAAVHARPGQAVDAHAVLVTLEPLPVEEAAG
jgi:propionyl-CoA carboxylase alpha chain